MRFSGIQHKYVPTELTQGMDVIDFIIDDRPLSATECNDGVAGRDNKDNYNTSSVANNLGLELPKGRKEKVSTSLAEILLNRDTGKTMDLIWGPADAEQAKD